MYLPIIVIFVFCVLFFIPIHSESINPPPNNVISGTFHDSEISLMFGNGGMVSGTMTTQDKVINLNNLNVIDRHDRFYIFDKTNNLKIFSKQISDDKYLVLVKYNDEKLRFIGTVDSVNKNTGQRDLFNAVNKSQIESKELSFKDQQLLKKHNKIQSSLDQRQKDIENMIKYNEKKDFGYLTKENILSYYNNYKTSKVIEDIDTKQETNSNNVSTNKKIKSFLSVPNHVIWKKELRYSVLITDDTRYKYDTSYNSWIGNKLKDITITGKITNPSNEVLQTFNGTTDISGQYINKFLIPDHSTTRGEYTVSINAVKTFSDNTKSKSSVNKIFFVVPPNTTFNNHPVSNAGMDRHYSTGSLVMLDGSASYDQDDAILYYTWNQTGGTKVKLSDNTVIKPTFRMPDVTDTFIFELLVNDGRKDSLKNAIVNFTSLHSSAGENKTYINNTDGYIVNITPITLDGSKSGDALDDHTINYLWTVIKGLVPTNSTITTESLTDNNMEKFQFTPDLFGNYTFQLKVHDGELHGLDDISNVTINVKNPTSSN